MKQNKIEIQTVLFGVDYQNDERMMTSFIFRPQIMSTGSYGKVRFLIQLVGVRGEAQV